MSAFANDVDEEQYEFGPTDGPPRGFPLPPESGYLAEREWLALTYDEGRIVSAKLVKALDPCVLAQRINLERVLSGGGIEHRSDAFHQEVRVLMELDEIDMVWRVESSLGDVRTTVQPSDHMDAVEDMEMHGELLEKRTEPSHPLAGPRVLPLTREVMASSRAVGELIDQAMDRSEEYAEAMDASSIAMTWSGLADAVGLAEAVFKENDPFLDGYRIAGVQLAEWLRPNSSSLWNARKDTYREAFGKRRNGWRHREAEA